MASNLIEKAHQYLCPPGMGVYTIHTAQELKEHILQYNFKSKDVQHCIPIWREQLELFFKERESKPILLGMCSDSGGAILRGAAWGPLSIRTQLIEDQFYEQFYDIGDVRCIPHLLHDKYLNEKTIQNCQKSLYGNSTLGSHLPVSPLSICENFCRELYAYNANQFLFGLGGDHSISYPLVKSWLQSQKLNNKKGAVLHFDAHTDLLDERLGIDLCFGSWAYHIIEELIKPSHLIQIGIRSSGKDKTYWEKCLGVQQFWSKELIEKGSHFVSDRICQYLENEKIDSLYISFDVDCIDGQYVSATGTPEIAGPNPQLILDVICQIKKHFIVTSADITEVAPYTHPPGFDSRLEPASTLNIASAIIQTICN